jgi:hypothetical protein
MEMCEEMKELRDWLTKHRIEFKDDSTIASHEFVSKSIELGVPENMADTSVFRTKFEIDDVYYSVIYGYCTYGGNDPITGDEKLLELECSAVNDCVPQGWLKASDIISFIKIYHGYREDD